MFCIIRGKKLPSLVRGYLRRFLNEIDSNLFIGKAKKDVIDKLWERIINSEEEDFSAVLILVTSSNEQGFILKEYNVSDKTIFREIDEILLFGGISSKNP